MVSESERGNEPKGQFDPRRKDPYLKVGGHDLRAQSYENALRGYLAAILDSNKVGLNPLAWGLTDAEASEVRVHLSRLLMGEEAPKGDVHGLNL